MVPKIRFRGLIGLLVLLFITVLFLLTAILGGLIALPIQNAGAAGGSFGGGDGSPGNPFLIEDVNDLQAMINDLDACYALANDIDASATTGWNSGAGFLPVGNNSNRFAGNLDGKGFTITGLFINRSSTNDVGLFGITTRSHVSNIGLVNVSITGAKWVGGLVGEGPSCHVSNSYVTGNVSGTTSVGGLVGFNFGGGSVSNSFAIVNVNGTEGYIGGLVGQSYGPVSNSYATGNVSGNSQVGGLVGRNWMGSLVASSYSTGNVSGSSYVGGLVGYNDSSTISDSFWDMETSGRATSFGGTGKNTAEMMNQSTFTGAGWDFTNTWWMVNGSTRPFLRMEWDTTIHNSHQLQMMAMNLSAAYQVANNISLSDILKPCQMWGTNASAGAGFLPVGNGTSQFTGSLDGRGYNISNLFINRSTTDYVGLFGHVGTGGSLSNVSLVKVNIDGQGSVGGLVGENDGMVNNSYTTGYVSGTGDLVGGLVGYNYKTVNNSYATGNVIGVKMIGGLVGYSSSTVSNSHAMGNVSGNEDVGGLVGYICGTVSNSSATSNVSGTNYVGGLAGTNLHGTVNKSYATGNVIGMGYCVGGLVGYNWFSTVNNSYATGNVSGSSHIGGLVGLNDNSTINNSYATGNVSGAGNAGGLVGSNYAMVNNSYATGKVSGDSDVGGLVGKLYSGTVNNSFYDSETSGQSDTSKGEPKTTAEMKSFSTFYDAGWDLICETVHGTEDIWGINEDGVGNNGYPFLSWQGFTNKVTFNINSSTTNASIFISSLGQADDGTLFVGVDNGSCYAISISENDGGDWTQGFIIPMDDNTKIVEIVPVPDYSSTTDIVYIATQMFVYVSQDGGKTASRINANIPGVAGGDLISSMDVAKNIQACATCGYVCAVGTTGSIASGVYAYNEDGFASWRDKEIGNAPATTNLFQVWDVRLNPRWNEDAERVIIAVAYDEAGGNTILTIRGMLGTWGVEALDATICSGSIDGALMDFADDYHWINSPRSFVAISGGIAPDAYRITSIQSPGAPSVKRLNVFSGTNIDVYDIAVNGSGSSVQTLVAIPDQDNYGELEVYKSTNVAMFSPTWYDYEPAEGDVYWLVLTSLVAHGLAHGSISPAGDVIVNCGGSQEFVITPDPCSHILDVKVNGSSVLGDMVDNSYTFTSVQSDYTINATFAINTYSLSYSTDGNGYIDGDSDQIVNCGYSGTEVTAVSNTCYHFVNWSDSSTQNPRTDTNVTGNITVTANFAFEAFSGGNGSAVNPYLIQNVCALQNMSSNLSACYALNNDIDASATSGWNGGAGFVPVGNDSNQFTDSLDGRGYTITRLFINRSATYYVGLFGYINSGSVSNVSLANVNITGKENVGGLIGYNYNGTVTNSSVAGHVSGNKYIGGLVGDNAIGTLNNSYTTGNVSGIGSNIGGLVGSNGGGGSVSNSHSEVNVTGGSHVGGLVGINYNSISNSYSTGNTAGTGTDVGGLVGFHMGTISNSYSKGTITGTNDHTGGLIGLSDGPVSNSYATGNVSGNRYVGGLAGGHYSNILSNSYATGSVSGNSDVGGLVGHNTAIVFNSFWDMQTSNQSSSAHGTGKNTSEMKDFFTFFNASWDIVCETAEGHIWGINESGTENNGYPFLWWQGFTHKVTFNLTTTVSGNGSASGDGIYVCGNLSEITATQTEPCWVFNHWTGSGITDVNASATTVFMDGDNIVQAVFVRIVWDVKCDGNINILDMIRIGQHWGQTGAPGWIPEDIRPDGVINVLDMILIGQNWTG